MKIIYILQKNILYFNYQKKLSFMISNYQKKIIFYLIVKKNYILFNYKKILFYLIVLHFILIVKKKLHFI